MFILISIKSIPNRMDFLFRFVSITLKTNQMKNIRDEISKLTDRTVMERILEYNMKTEKHLLYISNIATVFVVLSIIGGLILILN